MRVGLFFGSFDPPHIGHVKCGKWEPLTLARWVEY